MNKRKLWLIFWLSLTVCLGTAFSLASAQTDSADAIAVRVVPNPNHYSITRWYESQGFKGSPQALLVDGYEAIRDGRTVYVNAANLAGTNIFTNVYLISYNQDPAAATVDILGQIVSHWKFNSNLENSDQTYHCSISSVSCAANADCASNQVCATSSPAAGSCILKDTKTCLVDTDCPANFFCDSVKAKVSRDIKRIGKIEELKEALFKFKSLNGKYPTLSSGTYLAGHSLSVWPSWSQALLSGLAVNQSFFDPINRLGACPGYDQKTCWDKDKQKFYSTPSGGIITLPANSYAMAYSTDANGSNYNLCAVLESRAPSLNYKFSPNDPADSGCVTAGMISSGTASNTAPQLIDKYLVGESGREFNGFIKVADKEKNPLNWSMTAAGWLGEPLTLRDTSNPEQKKIYSAKAGGPGEYNISLTVSDGVNTFSTTTPIKIVSPSPFIEADNAEYILDQTAPFTYNFSFFSNNLGDYKSAYSVSRVSGPGSLDILKTAGAPTVSIVGSNKYQVSYKGLINTGFKLYQDANFVYKVAVSDKYGQNPSSKEFLIRVIVESPQLSPNCLNTARTGRFYSCLLGSQKQGNHNIAYTVSNQHPWLKIVGQEPLPEGEEDDFLVYLQGTSTDVVSSQPVTRNISVRAINEYGASSTKDFILKVNNFCGDGILQTPNTEGRGGLYNDGYEDCDGNDKTDKGGVTTSVSRDPNFQYGCATEANVVTPDPIPTGNYCVFKSPSTGGGYCGDGVCQLYIPTKNANGSAGTPLKMEDANSCPEDCQEKERCTPNCSGKNCGSDGCGGNCGTCSPGFSCSYSGNCTESSICTPNCTNKQCGDNGCGGSCGTCSGYQICGAQGLCVNPSCNDNNICEPNLGENCAVCPMSDCVCSDIDQTCDYTAMKCIPRFECIAQCNGRICGATNGCGGSCGSCFPGQVCMADGKSCCTPDCTLPGGKKNECGGDGCGGICGNCATDKAPLNWWKCVRLEQDFDKPNAPKVRCCDPSDCINPDRSTKCGGDGCGGICSNCQEGYICDTTSRSHEGYQFCVEKDSCGNGSCEPAKGENCSNCEDCKCAAGKGCNTMAVPPVCQCAPRCTNPDGTARICGVDGCGGYCGTVGCPSGKACDQLGQCTLLSLGDGVCGNGKCEPNVGENCGPDGVAGQCSDCKCTSRGECINKVCVCAPNCAGKICGDNGCGGSCGSCPNGKNCSADGKKCVIVIP
jgi:hypothetical protein